MLEGKEEYGYGECEQECPKCGHKLKVTGGGIYDWRVLSFCGDTEMHGERAVQEAAEKWKISPRQVQSLGKEGRIEGAEMMSRIWIIPKDAEKPTRKPKEKWQHFDNRKMDSLWI